MDHQACRERHQHRHSHDERGHGRSALRSALHADVVGGGGDVGITGGAESHGCADRRVQDERGEPIVLMCDLSFLRVLAGSGAVSVGPAVKTCPAPDLIQPSAATLTRVANGNKS